MIILVDDIGTGMRSTYVWMKWFGGHGLNTNRSTILHDDLVDFGVTLEMKVLVDGAGGMDVCVGRVTTTTSLVIY
jgi:hypothetical protein